MTLFGIGPGELILIFILALIIFGPNRLPEVARTIGKVVSEFRKTSEEVTTAVARELDVSDVVSGTDAAERPAQPAQPAIRPTHSIPLSSVGQVVHEPSQAPDAGDKPQGMPADGAPDAGPANSEERGALQDE